SVNCFVNIGLYCIIFINFVYHFRFKSRTAHFHLKEKNNALSLDNNFSSSFFTMSLCIKKSLTLSTKIYYNLSRSGYNVQSMSKVSICFFLKINVKINKILHSVAKSRKLRLDFSPVNIVT